MTFAPSRCRPVARPAAGGKGSGPCCSGRHSGHVPLVIPRPQRTTIAARMGTSGKDRPQDRLIVVDALRGVAALMVLIGHLPLATGVLSPLREVQATGHTGVGLFLVLSGFS